MPSRLTVYVLARSSPGFCQENTIFDESGSQRTPVGALPISFDPLMMLSIDSVNGAAFAGAALAAVTATAGLAACSLGAACWAWTNTQPAQISVQTVRNRRMRVPREGRKSGRVHTMPPRRSILAQIEVLEARGQ